MQPDQQKLTQDRFEAMFQKGHKPWRDHPIEPLYNQFFDLLASERPDAKLLDIGCGDGWATIDAAQKGFEAWGVDSSPTGITEAKQEAELESVTALTHFDVGDILQLGYEDSSFDAIIDGGLFHHIIPENRTRYLENVVRVLRNDGLFYLSAFGKNTDNEIGYHFSREEIETIFGKFFTVRAFAEDDIDPAAPFINLHFIMQRSDSSVSA